MICYTWIHRLWAKRCGGEGCLLLFICYPFQTPLSSALSQTEMFAFKWIGPPSAVTDRTLSFHQKAALLSKDGFCLQADIHLEILHNNAHGCNVTLVLVVRSSECWGIVTSVIAASALASLTKRKCFLFQGGWVKNPTNAKHTHPTISTLFSFRAQTPFDVFFLTSSNATVADIIFMLSLTRLKNTATVFCIIQPCNC